MNLNRHSILNSGIPLPELYRVLSSEGIRTTEFKSGVLLYFNAPSSMHYPCDCCLDERAACVRAAGGSIVHDTGDVILAEWPEERVQLRDAISRAVRCASAIGDTCGIRRAARNSRRAFKTVISAGRFSRVRLGDGEGQASVVFGPAADEMGSAETLAERGDIVLSPEAWRLCDRQKFVVEDIGDDGTMKVCHIRDQSVAEEDLSHACFDILMRGYPRTAYLVTSVERGTVVCEFMTQTALDKIHENWQWRELSEIWPACIMFMNLQFLQAQPVAGGGHRNIGGMISEQIFRCRGEICNAFFFEEGCIFVCVVGLPGDNRKDKAARALQAAYRIRKTCLREIDNLWSISIGVVTGRVQYKFHQRPLRKEYEVSGQLVRLAAKLVTDYPGIVSCDVATRLYSMLPLSCFMPQAPISRHEEVLYRDEVIQMLQDEALGTSSEMEGRRLALAHLQTMVVYEQTVVKYASVIGRTFSIEMLEHVLPRIIGDNLIPSLKSLVRVGIIQCASKPENSPRPTCDCSNKSREFPTVSMEPVWPCRRMTFCNADEMQMVRELIEKNTYLSRMIHTKCAAYLETKAYRCSGCEGKSFVLEHKAATTGGNARLREIYDATRPYEVFQSRGVPCQNEASPAEGHGNETENFLAKVKSMLTEARDRTAAGRCECAQLVEAILIPRLKHWKGAGDAPKTFKYLLESAAACVYLQNDVRALEYLTEARSILINLKERRRAFLWADPGHVRICEADQVFMHRLTGEILFRAGKLLEAEESFRKALKLLNCDLPHSAVAQSIKRVHEKMKKVLYRSRHFEIPEKTALGRLQECIDCLSFLWQIACARGQPRSASLAITTEINLAIRSTDPFKILYAAIDYLKYSQFKRQDSECRRLEAFLCRTCATLSDHPEGRRLIGHLTRTLAVVKLCAGDLEQSVECTTRAQELTEVLKEPGLDVRTTAALHLRLLLTDRYRESVQRIQALEKMSKEIPNNVAKGWFYAACMNSLLYAGFAFRPMEECLAFVEESQSNGNLRADKSLMLHLYSAVALWYARLGDWERFKVFFGEAHDAYSRIPTSIESVSGAAMLLECTALRFRRDLSERDSRRRLTLIRAHKLVSEVAQRFGKNRILTPRVLHLNAFLHMLTGRQAQAQDLIKEALLLCATQGNLLDRAWIRQSQADWSGSGEDTQAEWATIVRGMPSWDEAAPFQPEQLLQRRFRLKQAEAARPRWTLRQVYQFLRSR